MRFRINPTTITNNSRRNKRNRRNIEIKHNKGYIKPITKENQPLSTTSCHTTHTIQPFIENLWSKRLSPLGVDIKRNQYLTSSKNTRIPSNIPSVDQQRESRTISIAKGVQLCILLGRRTILTTELHLFGRRQPSNSSINYIRNIIPNPLRKGPHYHIILIKIQEKVKRHGWQKAE